MKISELKLQHAENIRELILESAVKIANESGWEGVTLRKLAEILGVSTSVVYHQFENKDQILICLMKKGFGLLAELWEKAVINVKSSVKQLDAIVETYWQFAFQHTRLYEVMHSLGKVSFDSSEVPYEVIAAGKIILPVMQGASNSGVSDENLYNRFDVLWGYMHGVVSLTLSNRIKGGHKRGKAVFLLGYKNLLPWFKT